MKCDRRWWNDGRLEREQEACVAHTLGLSAWRPHDHVLYAEPDEAYAVRIVCMSTWLFRQEARRP